MITLGEFNNAYRNASEAEKDEFIELILPKVIKNPSYESRIVTIIEKSLNNSFDARLATSELRPIKRIAELEQVTGLDDFGLDEEHEPTLPEQIELLADKLLTIKYQPSENPVVEIKNDTKTGKRASFLINKLRASGKRHLTHSEIKSILTDELPEDCKIDERAKNPRKTIIDVLNEAVSVCSDVFLDQKKMGHKEWRIALKS
jgi:hypothetical protein